MARINLLPWREEAREQRQKKFTSSLVLVAIVAGGLLYGGMMFLGDIIDKQKVRNVYLQKEISALDDKIKEIKQLDKKRETLLAKMDVIEELQENRIKAVKILDALANTVPKGIHLTRVTRRGDELLLSGIAQANARVSAFMRELDENEVFATASLSVVAREEDRKAFTLSVNENKHQVDEEGSE